MLSGSTLKRCTLVVIQKCSCREKMELSEKEEEDISSGQDLFDLKFFVMMMINISSSVAQ